MKGAVTKLRKGFTLIEMVVVIAIIGVLSAILIPSIINYIKKAQRRVDITTAKQIHTAIINVLTDAQLGDVSNLKHNVTASGNSVDDVYASYFVCKGTSGNVYKNVQGYSGGGMDPEVYDLGVCARITGRYIKGYSQKKYKRWNPVQGENQSFCDALNMRMFEDGTDSFVSSDKNDEYMLPMKYSPKTKTGMQADIWIIGWRADRGTDDIEVWAGSSAKWGGVPLYRVYPSPADEYTNENFENYNQKANDVFEIARNYTPPKKKN